MRVADEQSREVGGWEPVTAREFVESGALWKVNHDVLWPLGLAITARAPIIDDEGHFDLDGEVSITVQRTVPPEAIESAENDAKAENWAKFASERRATLR